VKIKSVYVYHVYVTWGSQIMMLWTCLWNWASLD